MVFDNTAAAELVDNSLEAKAKSILITIGHRQDFCRITDLGGRGMNYEELKMDLVAKLCDSISTTSS